MRIKKGIVIFLLAFCMLFSSITIAASSDVSVSGDKGGGSNIKAYVGVGVVVAGIAALIVHNININKKAEAYYKAAENYGLMGQWDKVVESYELCLKFRPKYRDARVKLEIAKDKAVQMFIKLGDDARASERYEEAAAYYQKALQYRPDSAEARSKLDNLSQNNIEFYYRRGVTYDFEGRLQEALAQYEQGMLIDPNYKDIKERYSRARAKLQGNLPSRGIIYFLNSSTQRGVENILVQALQNELVSQSTGKYAMIDYRKVQSVMAEQVSGLSSVMDPRLAMDVGRMLGASEVVVGEIKNVRLDGSNRVELSVIAKLMAIPSGDIKKNVELTHKFSQKTGLAGLIDSMPELAKLLASKLSN